MLSRIHGTKEGYFEMQRSTRTIFLAIAVLTLSFVAVSSRVGAQGRNIPALAPKPVELTPYTAPHKPHWKLSDVLALNPGKQSWSVTVVEDAGNGNAACHQWLPEWIAQLRRA